MGRCVEAIIFVSHAVLKKNELGNIALSAAGDSVQEEIIISIENSRRDRSFQCLNMTPNKSWPSGVFYSRGHFSGITKTIGYINFPFFRNLIFAANLFYRIFLSSRDAKEISVIFYNSYFFENAAAALAKILIRGVNVKIFCILQDAHVDSGAIKSFRGWVRSWFEFLGIVIARSFDRVYPVSKSMIRDLGFDERKCIVYFGGMTSSAYRLIEFGSADLEDFAVFAGGLEEYNGIKVLLEAWCEQDIPYPIHVFGRGSLEQFVRNLESVNKLIIFHGFVEQSVVESFQSKSKWNFCLRYSLGLNSEYFFPSKIFNIMAAPGALLMNRFSTEFDPPPCGLIFLENNLSNLSQAFEESRDISEIDVRARRDWLMSLPNWKSIVENIILSEK